MLDNLPTLLWRLRQTPVIPESRWHRPCSEHPERLIPHRSPYLLLDQICHVDAESAVLVATRQISADDPVFAGHFPGVPIYPACLLIEAMGQAAGCLLGLQGPDVPITYLVRIHHAMFLQTVGPGDNLKIEAAQLEADDLRLIAAGRIHRECTLCAIAIIEVHNANA